MGTREDLLAAATSLLDEGGAERVTLREVGQRAGVSHNAPYKHFADKRALLASVLAQEFSRFERVLVEARAQQAPPADLLRQVLLAYVRWGMRHPRRFALGYSADMAGIEDLDRAALATWRQVVAVTAEAQAAGELPAGDPERLAALARALAHGATELEITGHLAPEGEGRATAEDLVEDLIALMRRTP